MYNQPCTSSPFKNALFYCHLLGSVLRVMEKPHHVEEERNGSSSIERQKSIERRNSNERQNSIARQNSNERQSSKERQMENLHVAEERRSSSNKRQYAQWKMDTLSAQVPKHTF